MKNLGKYMYIIPLGIFGLIHFANANKLSHLIPDWMPLKVFLVYLTGIALIAAAISLIIRKKVKLAMTLLAIELLSFVILVHVMALVGGDQMALGQVLKDTALAGAAFYIASHSGN